MAWTEFYMQATGSNLNAGSINADAAVYTSAAGNWDGTSLFTPTDGQTTTSLVSVGDWASIYPTGNTTTPYIAQVTAVGAGVNGTITLSTTAKFGTAPVSNSGSRVCKTGGAWADFGMTATGVALNTGTVAQSTSINIKAGTYANGATARTLGLAGTTTAPLRWRGYKNTIGDQDTNNAAVAGTDIPAITATSGAFAVSGAHQTLSNLDFSATLVAALSVTSSPCTLYRVRATCTWANSSGKALSQNANNTQVIACYLTATSSATVLTTNGTIAVIGCEFKAGGIGLALAAANNNFVAFNIFDSQGSDAINTGTGTGYIGNNSIYAPIGNGINITGTPGAMFLVANNYFENVNQASKAAINNTSGTNTNLIRAIGNAYYNCTANTSGLGDSPLIFDNGTLASAGFVAPGSQNFALNGLALALAFPGLFENTNVYRGYLSPGAVQPSLTGVIQPFPGSGALLTL